MTVTVCPRNSTTECKWLA